eukprot:SAG31_NODE_22676_length_520_cov_0.900238_1_plen_35_part_01
MQTQWLDADQKHIRHLKPGTRVRLLGSTCIEMERH